MDWHISGFWVINSPVAWIRVYNYNDVPIKEVTIQYNTFDEANNPLDQGTYTIDETILPSQYRQYTDCIEKYLGLVSLYTERMSIKLISVQRE